MHKRMVEFVQKYYLCENPDVHPGVRDTGEKQLLVKSKGLAKIHENANMREVKLVTDVVTYSESVVTITVETDESRRHLG